MTLPTNDPDLRRVDLTYAGIKLTCDYEPDPAALCRAWAGDVDVYNLLDWRDIEIIEEKLNEMGTV